jgi:cell shape-determining protein MreC
LKEWRVKRHKEIQDKELHNALKKVKKVAVLAQSTAKENAKYSTILDLVRNLDSQVNCTEVTNLVKLNCTTSLARF